MIRMMMAAIAAIALSATALSAQTKAPAAKAGGDSRRSAVNLNTATAEQLAHDSRRGAKDGGAHHRLPAEERRLQENRGPDERERGGRERASSR